MLLYPRPWKEIEVRVRERACVLLLTVRGALVWSFKLDERLPLYPTITSLSQMKYAHTTSTNETKSNNYILQP